MNKKYFSSFLKGFQLPEIVSDSKWAFAIVVNYFKVWAKPWYFSAFIFILTSAKMITNPIDKYKLRDRPQISLSILS